MSPLPNTLEDYAAKLPALLLLQRLGYSYLTPDAATELRRGKTSEPLLRQVLLETLQAREFVWKGRRRKLSSNAVADIIRRFAAPPMVDGLLAASETLYQHLTLGVTVTEFVDGATASVTIPLIDWDQPERNVFHVTDEYPMQNSAGTGKRVPDIVCFVNGIPLAIIEAKRPDPHNMNADMLAQAISQHVRNQRLEEIPALYAYAQLLLAVDSRDGRYGTTATPSKFWALWREEEIGDDALKAIKNRLLSSDEWAAQFSHRPPEMGEYFREIEKPGLTVSNQDKLIVSLLRPDRLLTLARRFLVYDKVKGKLVARYQQFFGVRRLAERVQQRTPSGGRQGGVIWHTTGSGKSLTMVLLAKALILEPALRQCRFIVVTDRVDLEQQLAREFVNTGAFGTARKLDEVKATTGSQLAKRIGTGNDRILFSIIDKFRTATKLEACKNPSDDLIVLVDEGHRSHGGETHERMRQALPNAAYVAFTGTPLLKDEKTAQRFGGIVHAYPMQQAVKDKAVSPLLYEERRPDLVINDEAVDAWFDRIALGLTDQQRADLKKKYGKAGAVHGADGRIELIAYDLSLHFRANVTNGMKALLATDSKRSALRYKRYLDEIGMVSSAVVISAPDTRENHETIDDDSMPEIQRWWKEHVGGRGEKAYTEDVKTRFKQSDDPQLLIVVDKLLTGYDEPRCSVLYIDKPLKQHNLIQAIARVNRLHDAKEHGLLVDYRGILKELDMTIDAYRQMQEQSESGYDANDLQGLYAQVSAEYKQLPRLHKAVWAFFSGVKNKGDQEQYRQVLMPKFAKDDNGESYDTRAKLRDEFEDALRAFANCLQVALGSAGIYQDSAFSEADIETYKRDIEFFERLRRIARNDAGLRVDYTAFDARIKAMIDKHVMGVGVAEPQAIYRIDKAMEPEGEDDSDPSTWSDDKARNQADLIRARIKRTIDETLDDDPYGKKAFSELLNQAIEHAESLFDHPHKLFALFRDTEAQMQAGEVPGLPRELHSEPYPAKYFGVLKLLLGEEFPDAGDALDDYVAYAREIDITINRLVGEHSVNPVDLEKAVRKALLPGLFKRLGMERASQAVEQIIHVIRVGASKA